MTIPDIRETALTCASRWTQFQRDQRKLAEIIGEALNAERERWQDKIDGLSADLDNAVETAFKRGATEWTRLNYPEQFARLSAIRQSKEPVE